MKTHPQNHHHSLFGRALLAGCNRSLRSSRDLRSRDPKRSVAGVSLRRTCFLDRRFGVQQYLELPRGARRIAFGAGLDVACLRLFNGVSVRLSGKHVAALSDRRAFANTHAVFLRLVEGREDFKRIILSLRRTVRCAFSDLRR